MAITSDYKSGAAQREFEYIQREIDFEVVRAMSYAGEKFVKDARNMTKSQGGFGDVTGNLRSSIGYFILKDGEIVKSNTKQFSGRGANSAIVNFTTKEGKSVSFHGKGKSGDGSKGMSDAIFELLYIPTQPGFQLVGIAGMNYASAVESRGLNVITLQGDVMLIDLERFYKILENRFK